MKTLPLTRGYVALIDDSDYEMCSQFKWNATVRLRKDKSIMTIYAMRNIHHGMSPQYLHRFIVGAEDSSAHVDHCDHDGLNCQRYNLRVSNNTQNHQNLRKRSDNSTGFKGVAFDKRCGRWLARIMVNRKFKHLGMFGDPVEAARAYDAAALANFGQFACTNFPPQPIVNYAFGLTAEMYVSDF